MNAGLTYIDDKLTQKYSLIGGHTIVISKPSWESIICRHHGINARCCLGHGRVVFGVRNRDAQTRLSCFPPKLVAAPEAAKRAPGWRRPPTARLPLRLLYSSHRACTHVTFKTNHYHVQAFCRGHGSPEDSRDIKTYVNQLPYQCICRQQRQAGNAHGSAG